jgi:hypothetical protein
MNRLGPAVLVSLILLTSMVAVPVVGAAGNVDAARACQEGGYATLQGTDGTVFKNAGQCVSHVARGGTITGVSAACTYTSGTSGCIEFDNVVVPVGNFGSTGSTNTTLAGMFSFTPATDWPVWYGTTFVTVTGSGTWVASTGSSGTWTATHASSIYPGQFYNSSGPAQCNVSTTRYVGVHFDVYQSGALVGAIEIQVRNATTDTNFVLYQGFTTGPSGEPWGTHSGVDMSGVTFRC